jgi:DNA topoisomerase-1
LSYLRGKFGFTDYEYTKKMEEQLDAIAAGKSDYLSLIASVNGKLNSEIISFTDSHIQKCPECGESLRHLVKTGQDAYNFWACTNREKCVAKFKDDNGKPGAKQSAFGLSDHKCAVCGQNLRHLVKEGQGGYNFWACSGKECIATYQDDNGKPGPLNTPKEKQPPTEFKCKACKSPLYRCQGHSQKTGKDYDFFACSNKKCGKTFQGKDGKPDF